jgi:hypothetical protein
MTSFEAYQVSVLGCLAPEGLSAEEIVQWIKDNCMTLEWIDKEKAVLKKDGVIVGQIQVQVYIKHNAYHYHAEFTTIEEEKS